MLLLKGIMMDWRLAATSCPSHAQPRQTAKVSHPKRILHWGTLGRWSNPQPHTSCRLIFSASRKESRKHSARCGGASASLAMVGRCWSGLVATPWHTMTRPALPWAQNPFCYPLSRTLETQLHLASPPRHVVAFPFSRCAYGTWNPHHT